MKLRTLIITFLILPFFACAATPNMKLSQPSNITITANSEKALVYFIRPQKLGFLINAAVYDGEEFIGFVPYNQKLPYLVSPGEHRFMVVSEAADFMDAKLLPGKTYYVEVVARMGAWRARFSLLPITKNELYTNRVKTWIESAQLIENKPSAYDWAKENRPSVLEKKETYLKKWLEKDKDQRPYLHPDDSL